ncbi:MAG: ABC-F type ribosomal protection protein [Lachnospiraceae bacterium]|nr:ABC-F type ribosomal protection protein [Lachnospiraceae bacterium]
MSRISVNDLTFYYDGSYDMIFDHVSFEIDTDWKLGFIGRNGRGKTTFLNLLLGKYEYRGNIQSSVTFDYFPFVIEEKKKQENTIDVIEMIYPEYELWKICRELTILKTDADILYRPFCTLSNGEQTKVMLAMLFSKDHNFLLIDEPTNHLDMTARDSVREYLKQKKGFILVSHDRVFLNECIDHVLVINKTNIEVMNGNFDDWWMNKTRRDESEEVQNEKLKKEMKRLSEAAKRNEAWSDKVEKSKIGEHSADRGFIGAQSARMMKRSKVIERRVAKAMEEKAGLLKNVETMDDLKIIPLRHYKEILVKAEDLSLYYGERQVFESLDFEVRNGECVALEGRNGCGKSSVLKKIVGDDIHTEGKLFSASGMIVSYVPQNTSFLKGSLNAFIEENHLNQSLMKTLLRKLDFEREQFEKRMEEFSEGQKKKVLIAKSLSEQAHLYVWDEPLNFIDVFSRMQIEQLIKEFKPTLLLVDHDDTFIQNVAQKRVRMTLD